MKLQSFIILMTLNSMLSQAQTLGNAHSTTSTGNANAPASGNNIYREAGNAMGNNPNFINYNKPKGVDLNVYVSNGSNTNLKADIMMNAKADSYVAILSITQTGETITETDSLMDLRLNTFFKGLAKVGIPIENTHVDFISLLPSYQFVETEKRYTKTLNEMPSGFEMKKNVHIRFVEHDRINDIISSAAKSEIYDLVKVDYNIADMESIYAEMSKKAEEVIKKKLDVYERLGFHLTVQNFGINRGSVYPMERYAFYSAYKSGTPKPSKTYKPGERDKTVLVNYTEKDKTVYYEKVPYNQFDLVMNAETTEPTIQVHLSMSVNYTVMSKEQWDEIVEQKRREKQKNTITQNHLGGNTTINTNIHVKK